MTLVKLADEPVDYAGTLPRALGQAVGRTLDLVTTRRCLDEIAIGFPEIARAVRNRLTDEVVTEVYRQLGAELPLADVLLVLESLLEPTEPDICALVAHVRRPIVEQHLFSVLGSDSTLPVFTLRPEDEELLLSLGRPPDLTPDPSVLEKMLTTLADLLPTSAWNPESAAVVVNSTYARPVLRHLLSAQAPDLWILQAEELPGWLEVEVAGTLSLRHCDKSAPVVFRHLGK